MIYQLNPHNEELLEEFQQKLDIYYQLAERISGQLNTVLRSQGIALNTVEKRVKALGSLKGKLELKGDKYKTLEDITDLVGIRVITFYNDDVDKVAAIVNQLYDVDWSNSIDKRKAHEFNSFGYNSLHYVCRLHKSERPEYLQVPFEIQMRTTLQHAWSAIEHDLGYKSSIKLPFEYRRQFSRLAGLLELADEEFSRLRTTMTEYRRHLQGLVSSGRLEEVPLTEESFRSFLELKPFDRLNRRIAKVNQAEIVSAPLMSLFPILEDFGFQTLADVQHFIDDNTGDAYRLALSQLAITDIDILSEMVGPQNLCMVYSLKKGEGEEGVRHIYDRLYGPVADNTLLAKSIIDQASTMSFVPRQ